MFMIIQAWTVFLQATFAEQKVFKFVWLHALFCHFAKPTTTLAVKNTEVNDLMLICSLSLLVFFC